MGPGPCMAAAAATPSCMTAACCSGTASCTACPALLHWLRGGKPQLQQHLHEQADRVTAVLLAHPTCTDTAQLPQQPSTGEALMLR